MTPATLLVTVLIVYLLQCLCWARPQVHVFTLEPSGRSGQKRRGYLWVALKVRMYWANPLPPLQPLLVVDWPQIQPEVELVRVPQTEGEPASLPWQELTVTRSGARLLCNGLVVLQGGADQLKWHQEFLEKLKRAKVKDRKKLIESWLRKAMDTGAAEERLNLFRKKYRWLDVAVNLQFFLLFVIVPLAFFRFGSKALWPMLAAVIAVSAFISWQLWRLHKDFFPEDGDGRFKAVFGSALSPIYAIRAGDALGRELLAGFHPAAVAGAVCSKQEFEDFAGEQLRANRFSGTGASWYGDQIQFALGKMLGKKGVAAEQLLAAPEQDGNCVLYCPRCRAQYTKTREGCADCGYEELLTFAEDGKTLKPAGEIAVIGRDRTPMP
ncbi:MAG TPA: hypothetical protein VH724_07530 [Candidatus Angelobacter sp.]|nr:hypothetical protein [Candidatus Angelobacter sp.]